MQVGKLIMNVLISRILHKRYRNALSTPDISQSVVAGGSLTGQTHRGPGRLLGSERRSPVSLPLRDVKSSPTERRDQKPILAPLPMDRGTWREN